MRTKTMARRGMSRVWRNSGNRNLEGIGWVSDDRGHPAHPLHLQCSRVISTFRRDCQEASQLDETTDNPLTDLIVSAHMINTKLTGALNSLWMRHEDGGFIVACLKRSLKYFNKTMGHFPALKTLIPDMLLTQCQTDLGSVREEILRLMDRYRDRIYKWSMGE